MARTLPTYTIVFIASIIISFIRRTVRETKKKQSKKGQIESRYS